VAGRDKLMGVDQIKRLATASTNLGMSAIIAGIIVPFIGNNGPGSGWLIGKWFVLAGMFCIGVAQVPLGRLP
jgi:hypothetical protein